MGGHGKSGLCCLEGTVVLGRKGRPAFPPGVLRSGMVGTLRTPWLEGLRVLVQGGEGELELSCAAGTRIRGDRL